jgi:hypothetical protein
MTVGESFMFQRTKFSRLKPVPKFFTKFLTFVVLTMDLYAHASDTARERLTVSASVVREQRARAPYSFRDLRHWLGGRWLLMAFYCKTGGGIPKEECDQIGMLTQELLLATLSVHF